MDKIVLVWCAQSGKNLGALKGHTQPVTCLCWQPLHVAEGDSFPLLATSSKDAAVRIWAALMQFAIIKFSGMPCCRPFLCFCISHHTLGWDRWYHIRLVSLTFLDFQGHICRHMLTQPHLSLAASDANTLVRWTTWHRRCGLQRWQGLRDKGMEPKGWSHADSWIWRSAESSNLLKVDEVKITKKSSRKR